MMRSDSRSIFNDGKRSSVFMIVFLIAFTADSVSQVKQTDTTKATANLQSPWQSIPATWKSLDHHAWLQELQLTKVCHVKAQGSDSRFLQQIKLNTDTTLLLLACKLGAYQDAYYGYLLQAKYKRFKPLEIEVPKDNNGNWTFTSSKLIWGSVWKENTSKELEITFLSAATGMCGHRSFYPIDTLINSEISLPSRAYADNDCYNGIRVEDWATVK